jgi:hypothetical protein
MIMKDKPEGAAIRQVPWPLGLAGPDCGDASEACRASGVKLGMRTAARE